MPNTCRAPGCDAPPRTGSATLCSKHYHRVYRHSSLDRTAREATVSVSEGRRYRSLHMPAHPLAGKSGGVYEHRLVLFDMIGTGEHPCHWCACALRWNDLESPLQVDHLNGTGDDNRPANLVPACRRCNSARAQQRRAAALRVAGWWSGHDTVASTGRGRMPAVEVDSRRG